MRNRSKFPGVFWTANLIEILERFAYYGIYMSFGIYLQQLGFSKGDLGIIQSIFLLLSYLTPIFSGTIADKYGFRKMLIVSYLAYLPSILLLIVTRTFSGIALTMLSIGLAAGIFKPLIAATVRATTDSTNKTLGYGIYYAMVNIGASIGPVLMGKLHAISWDYVFYTAAGTIGLMLIITLLFYKEPARDIEGVSLRSKFRDMKEALSDVKFLIFIILLGLFFWLPFWSFFNILAVYIDDHLNKATLYRTVKGILGETIAGVISHQKDGVWMINAEAISHTGYIIILFQVIVSRISEKRPAIPSFLFGLLVISAGFIVLGFSATMSASLVFLGVFLFAVGEMTSSPRIQEYIMWIAPKEKAGLYMGTSFLATAIGALFSGLYTGLLGVFEKAGKPQYIMFTLALHSVLGIAAIWIFTRTMGEFSERNE